MTRVLRVHKDQQGQRAQLVRKEFKAMLARLVRKEIPGRQVLQAQLVCKVRLA